MAAEGKRLVLTRDMILGHRRRVSSLDTRLPAGSAALERAAWAGLQDSAPRAALLSLHARVEGVAPNSWEDPALMQVWGPRWAVYVIAAADRPLFTVSRYPDDARGRQVAEDMAARLAGHMGKGRMRFDDAATIVTGDTNRIRYATATGTVAIRWDGARQPDLWLLSRPKTPPVDARRDVARRYLHVFGPSSAPAFARWLGIDPAQGLATFDALTAAGELLAVSTPIGEALVLASDEASFRAAPGLPAAARLLPSGDTYTLLKGADRDLLVPDAAHRQSLWTPRVWPGALLVSGEIVGTWRRDQHNVSARAWRALTRAEISAVEREAVSLPLPGPVKQIALTWEG